MRFVSTNGRSPAVGFREAVLRGLAPDGGLYLPDRIPPLPPHAIEGWRGLPIDEVAVRLVAHMVGDEFEAATLQRLVREAFSFPAPVVDVAPGMSVLELFHGPTLAFKDFGARALARVFGQLLADRGDHATILVATSGDTGSAVAHGFHGVAGVRVVVLYPAGRVSAFQEAQMATLGGNVSALRVPGTFDDCQRLVKQAFSDEGLAALRLSSANSINVGRLLPQAVYYVVAALTRPAEEPPPVFSVPSGNLGNLTAGILATRLGLRVARFISATNVNDVLPEYLRTEVYRARPSIPTISNAMDVGDPSNFARLSQLHEGSAAALRAVVDGVSIPDSETRATIRRVHARTGYVLDPHGAVGWAAGERMRESGSSGRATIVLATAHPAKFGRVISEELGFEPSLPDAYHGWASRLLLADDLPDTTYDGFRRWLLG